MGERNHQKTTEPETATGTQSAGDGVTTKRNHKTETAPDTALAGHSESGMMVRDSESGRTGSQETPESLDQNGCPSAESSGWQDGTASSVISTGTG